MSTVAVVGSVNLDLVADCESLPVAGETVFAESFFRHPGGKGANQALAACRSGSDVRLIAAVGSDAEAELALHLLEAAGVLLDSVVVDRGAPTGLALITVDATGENSIVVVPGANATLTPADVDVSEADLVLCQLEVPMEVVEEAAAQTDGYFAVNVAPATQLPQSVLEAADLLILNEGEREAMGETINKTGALVVVTLGAAGARAFRGGRLVGEALPPPVEVVDTVGAGDTFCGALATALLEGRSVAEGLRFACAAGALATTVAGAQPSIPTRDAILAAIR